MSSRYYGESGGITVNTISGDLDTFDDLLYGNDTSAPREYLEEQNNSFRRRVRGGNNNTSRFFEAVWAAEDAIVSSRPVRLAQAAVRKVKTVWQTDEFRELAKLVDLQRAPDVMKPYLMAEPVTRKLWQKGLCDGYGDVAEEHRDVDAVDTPEYSVVMNGVIVETPDDEECEWYSETIQDDFADALGISSEFEDEDQENVLDAWDMLRYYIAVGKEDPTAPENTWLSY